MERQAMPVTGQQQFVARAGRLVGVGLAAGGLIATFVVAWSLVLSVSGHRQFGSSREIVLYFGVPLGLALFLFASLRLSPTHRLHLAVSGVTFMLSVYALEGFLTAFRDAEVKPVMTLMAESGNKSKFAAELARQFGTPVDIRAADEAVAQLQRDGVDAVRIVTPYPLLSDQPDGSLKSMITIEGREVIPLGSVSNKVTLLCNEKGTWIDYRSDSRGFNNHDEIWQSSRFDIAVVGDSYAQGYCVPPDRNFVALIRQRHAGTLNLGIAGDGPLLTLATLTEYLPRLKPKIVLWSYYEGNDLTDLQRERRSALLRRYLNKGFTQADLARQAEIDREIMAAILRLEAMERVATKRQPLNGAIYQTEAFAKLTALRTRLNLIVETDAATLKTAADLETANMDVLREVLNQARARVDAWGGQLLFMYLPEWAHYTSYRAFGKTKHHDVLTLVRSLGIPIIDLVPVFQAQDDPLSLFPFRGPGHYAEAGHRLVAEEVLSSLQSNSRADSQ